MSVGNDDKPTAAKAKLPYTDMVPGRAILEVMGLVLPKQSEGGVVHPETYLIAGSELLAFMFAIVWLTTVIFNPGVIDDNPILMKLGYNNFCVGLDSQPAKSPGQILYVVLYYVWTRYAVLNIERSFERRRAGKTSRLKFVASVLVDIFWMFSVTYFSLVWMIDPWMTMLGHTSPFILLIFARWFVIAVRMVETPTTTWRGWLFLFCNGIVSLFLPYYYLKSGRVFDATGKHWLPWWVGMSVDYIWFAGLPLASLFLHLDADDLMADKELHSGSDADILANAGSLIDGQTVELMWDARHLFEAWFVRGNLLFIFLAAAYFTLMAATSLSFVLQ
uniref:Uncharacterized protein n=1 Tax=Noctiluca scintillans TaxID=2966 RepID=A0A7S1A2Y6_NOCSC|mmetsp:Transcript_28974/g.76440  ORF Transcript_28974/g.76440 Transcript_28974/m.76440 type:complete len:333 (+) Transcript_28974:61-1059(+)